MERFLNALFADRFHTPNDVDRKKFCLGGNMFSGVSDAAKNAGVVELDKIAEIDQIAKLPSLLKLPWLARLLRLPRLPWLPRLATEIAKTAKIPILTTLPR